MIRSSQQVFKFCERNEITQEVKISVELQKSRIVCEWRNQSVSNVTGKVNNNFV